MSALARFFHRFCRAEAGNVAMIFGISFLPLLIAVGVAVDYTNATAVQQKLAGTADAVALAAARSYKDVEGRDAVGQRYLDANMDEFNLDVTITNLNVVFDDDDKIVTVSLTADIPTHIMQIVGHEKQTVTINSKVSYDGHVAEPVSLAMVLDVSGSMGWNNKIGTLRTAATDLLEQLDEADPDNVYVRTGLVTYSTGIRQTVAMDWGVDHTTPVVQALTASGGTASTAAVEQAGDWLVSPVEDSAHESQPAHEGEEFELHKFMIFMTDGDNNHSVDDDATEALCDSYKAQGVEIFSVAFEAPYGGRQLLQYCASSEEHYFDASDAEEFMAAFSDIADRIESALLRIVE